MSEQYSGHEPASQEELRRLKELTAVFAIKNGDYIDNGGKVIDELEGLPVVLDHTGEYTVTLHEAEINRLAPSAITALELAGDLVITYFPPQYEKTGDEEELEYTPASAMFRVGKPKEHSLHFETLVIADMDEEGMVTDRLRGYKRPATPDAEIATEDAERIIEHVIQGIRQADAMGLAAVSSNEVKALSDIINAASAAGELN